MMTWKEFATAQPGLAEVGRSLLFQFKVGLAFLATVRRDGAPRLHPVCPVLSNGRRYHRQTVWVVRTRSWLEKTGDIVRGTRSVVPASS